MEIEAKLEVALTTHKQHISLSARVEMSKDLNRNNKTRYLSTTVSNLGVIGVGLGLWQDGSLWVLFSGCIAIVYGYILSGRISQ